MKSIFMVVKKMEKEILELLCNIEKDNKEFRNEVNSKLDNITNKLQAVCNQTANLMKNYRFPS